MHAAGQFEAAGFVGHQGGMAVVPGIGLLVGLLGAGSGHGISGGK